MDKLKLSKIDFSKKLLEKNRSNFLVRNKIKIKKLVLRLFIMLKVKKYFEQHKNAKV
jgi:hypothetical protein